MDHEVSALQICKLSWEPLPSGEARGRRVGGTTAGRTGWTGTDTDVKAVPSVCLCPCAAAVDEESAARSNASKKTFDFFL